MYTGLQLLANSQSASEQLAHGALHMEGGGKPDAIADDRGWTAAPQAPHPHDIIWEEQMVSSDECCKPAVQSISADQLRHVQHCHNGRIST